jgi:L-2-hydroxyglutarate oxidase LhgO
MERVDTVVIGAGVVGLATARALALRGCDVLVLERNDAIGMETSARNSEVIHAGIYYPTGTLKAALCVQGKEQLYAYCAEHGVRTRRCGKLIVAADVAQLDALRSIRRQGRANGAGELAWLDAADAAALEPHVQCVAAVYSETTGIIDSHAYMLALQGDLEAAGGAIAFQTPVRSLQVDGGMLRVHTDDLALRAERVVNAAGLQAPDIARQTGYQTRGYFARGRYYSYSGAAPFQHLVYPVPEPGGLGVHVTLDLAGSARFGPDVAWIDDIDYRFDDSARERFAQAIRGYYPGLDESRLQPGYTGIRPKISGPGEPAADFRIDGPLQHGVEGLVHLLGIESPGLTASLAIADRVAEALAC